MPRLCESCRHPEAKEIDRKIRAGTTFEDVSRWLLQEHDTKLSAPSIGQHARKHLGHINPKGRRPRSTDLLQAVVDDAAEQLAAGQIRASLKDGISAQKAIDQRAARNADRDLMLKLALTLSGAQDIPYLADPETQEIEGEFRELLTPGAA